MDKETKAISEVQEAEASATKAIEKSLSKKQAQMEEASVKARQIVAEAEQKAKEEMAHALSSVQKEIDATKGQESKATQKLVEGVKKRKLSQAKVAQIAEQVAKEIAGE
ncbi:MAG: hypothetical protein KGH59_03570 [Candidatus Micrarchaeota archaeon]|nr:hypothetical protein [Candidatus Micrarchaeota archaeon]MDE1804835.1 hypothetical protein [Candidatus Micrarchaeota archaeon]